MCVDPNRVIPQYAITCAKRAAPRNHRGHCFRDRVEPLFCYPVWRARGNYGNDKTISARQTSRLAYCTKALDVSHISSPQVGRRMSPPSHQSEEMSNQLLNEHGAWYPEFPDTQNPIWFITNHKGLSCHMQGHQKNHKSTANRPHPPATATGDRQIFLPPKPIAGVEPTTP